LSDTAVPSIEFTETGLVLPQGSAVLAGVQSDINAAFGGKLNPALNTPQGQLASSLSAIIEDNNDQFAEFVNQVDPDTNDGFMQDAIARIYFLNRSPGASTVVQCVCVGALGTVIPVGAQAKDNSGNLYLCTQAGTIPVGGSITLPFANAVVGPIACPANTLSTIYQAIPGWDTINNPADGVVGANVETAAEFRQRRDQSVALNAHGSLPSIYAAVFDVSGVIDAYATENVTDAPIVVGSTNYTLLPHSVYVAVTGGLASDIAQAIWTKKDLGANMNGNTVVIVTDESGYSFPQPAYNITFERPPAVPYNFIVNIKNSSALPGTIVADVTAAIAAQFNGVVGALLPNGIVAQTSGARVRIGSLLLAAAFYGAVATCEGPAVPVQVLSIFLGTTFTGLGTLVTGTDVLTITTASTGSLTPGTAVTGTDIPAGTTIVQQLTGPTGGTGTYQMSANATATVGAPEAIVGAGSTAQQIGIDQQPTLGTVVVNLV
jgi:uncharacterized phage protein gp47/JayE